MTRQYVMTFFTHFDAISFARAMKKQGVEAELAPVPRVLSSSCGTCAIFYAGEALPPFSAEYEKLYVREAGGEYTLLHDAQ